MRCNRLGKFIFPFPYESHVAKVCFIFLQHQLLQVSLNEGKASAKNVFLESNFWELLLIVVNEELRFVFFRDLSYLRCRSLFPKVPFSLSTVSLKFNSDNVRLLLLHIGDTFYI